MRKIKLSQIVAFILAGVLVLEDPMTALAGSSPYASEEAVDPTEGDVDASDGTSDPAELTDKDSPGDVSVKTEADLITEGLEEESLQEGFEAVSDVILTDNDDGTELSGLKGGEESDPVTEADEEGVIESKVVPEETGNSAPLTYELAGSRTENSLTYSRSDHSFTTFYYTDPVSFKADDGSWRIIDNRLHYSEAEESIVSLTSDDALKDYKDATETTDHDAHAVVINNAAGDKPSDSSEDPDVPIIEESASDGINSYASKEEIDNKDSEADLQDFDGFSNNDAAFDVKFAEEATTDHIFSFKEGKNSIVLAYVPTVESRTPQSSDRNVDEAENPDKSNKKVDKVGSDSVSIIESDPDSQKADIDANAAVTDILKVSNDMLSGGSDNKNKISDTEDNNTASWSRKITLLEPKTGDEIDKQSLIDACDDTQSDSDGISAPASSDDDQVMSDIDAAMFDNAESDETDAIGFDDDKSVDTEIPEVDDGTGDNEKEIYYPELPLSQTVLYQDIEDGVDLRYELLPEGIKETIVLSKAGVPASYAFTLNVGTMRAERNDKGDVYLYDTGQDPAFEIPSPVVSDAKGIIGRASYDMTTSDDGCLTLEVRTDAEWLNSPDRAYPIEIDPTIKKYRKYTPLSGYGDFVSIGTDGTKSTDVLKVGKTMVKDEKGKKTKAVTYRTFMNPILPEIDKGSVVTDAKLRLSAGSASEIFYCVPVPDEWKTDSISSSKLPFKTVSYKNSLKNVTDFGKNGTVLLDVTRDVKKAASGGNDLYGWCFASANESVDTVRSITPFKISGDNKKPYFEVTYKDFTGTEDYYTTHTQSAGSAGTGSINDYTGRLTFAHVDATSAGDRMPLSISHVYDIAYGERMGEDKWLTAATASGVPASAYGNHFRLSTDVRLLVPAGETDVSKYPYVYVDSDGTRHYFKKTSVTYYVNGSRKDAKSTDSYPAAKDEDGLGLFVVPVENKTLKELYPLKIVDKSGSTSMYFDESGYLRRISDSNQREDGKNADKKAENSIFVDYDDVSDSWLEEKTRLRSLRDEINGYYEAGISDEEMTSRARTGKEKLEAFENEALCVSTDYVIALNVSRAKENLQNILEGSTKHESEKKNAVSNLDKALKGNFSAKVKRASSVTDAAGVTAVLNYDPSGRLTSMSDPFEGGALITYSYDKSGNLIRIDHPNSTYGAYGYDAYGHLIRATDESGYGMYYAYGDKKSTSDRVSRFTEYVGKKAGQTVLVDYAEFNCTSFTYSGLDEKTGTKDDIENVYCFDHKGRTTSAYSRMKKTKEVIGARLQSFTDEDSDSTSSANKVKESASTGSQVINLLTDSGFEKDAPKNGTDAWETFISNESKGNAVEKNSSDKYIGSRSAHVKLSSGAGSKEGGFKQTISAPATGWYTASVYVKADGLSSDAKAKIRLSARKSASESSDSNDSEKESGEESGEGGEADVEDGNDDDGDVTSEEGMMDADTQPDINNGWKRLETTIKAARGEIITLTLSLTGTSGEAWFDCAQIEKGTLANQYNMLPNSGFEAGFKPNASLPDIPSGWAYGAEAVKATESVTDDETGSGFPDDDEEAAESESTDDADASAVRIISGKATGGSIIEGTNVLAIKGNPIKRRSVIINPNFGSDKASYTFSCYVKADCAPLHSDESSSKRKCGIYARGDKAGYNEDDATGKYVSISGRSAASAIINTDTKEWQYVTVSLPTRSWKGKLIEIRFDYEIGDLYVDGCMLTKNEVQTKDYTAGGRIKTNSRGERTTTYATDVRERRKKETTAGGATTTYKYDNATNDLITETHSFKSPGGSSLTDTSDYAYDTFGNTIKVSETAKGVSQSIVSETEYDETGRFAVSNVDSRGYESSSVYDTANGELMSSTDALNVSTSYEYDKYHQPLSVESEGVDASYAYNSKLHDLVNSIKIGEGRSGETYAFTYDAYGNAKGITRSTKDKKLITNTYYPNNGKLKSTQYGNGNKLTFGYNALEQVTSETWSGKDVTRYEYDNRGNRARITDAASGLKYRYFYDDHDRITTAEVLKTSGKTTSGLISFQSIYDKAGRQSVFAYYTGGRAYRTEYGYTSDDKVAAATLPTGGVFNRTYDGFDRITKDVYTPHKKAGTGESKAKNDGAPVTVTYGYLNTDRNKTDGSKTAKNGNVTYSYTTRLLSDLEITVGSGKNVRTAVSESLSYDELGRISGLTTSTSAYSDLNSIADDSQITYTYDKLGRLIRAEDAGKGRMWEYAYDSMGNVTSSTYKDEEGEIHEDAYTYDRDNLTTFNGEKADGYKGGNPKTYLGNTLTWARGRQLMSVTPTKKRTDHSAADAVTFTYAYDGSRLSKTVGKTKKSAGTTTEYILNGSTILAQNTTYPDGRKETLNFYYSSDGKLIEIGYLKGDADGIISKDAIETHYSVIRNAMGDVAAIYTATGTLVGTYEYDPYGRLLSETSNLAFDDSENILHKNPFRYRGYYYDSETGWYYLQSRYYDPEVKRFINADSTNLLTTGCSNLMQYNLFMYCNGDPINQKDEYGHMPYLLFAVAVGAVSGFIGQCFTDIVAYAKSGGEYQFSPEAYAGAIVGGAAGGAALALSGDPTIANFVTGAATTATTQLLEKATGKNDRSYAEIALNAGFDGTASAVLGAISFGNPLSNTVESAQNNYIAQLRAANPSLGPRLGEIGYDLTLDEIDGAVKTSISSGLRLDLYYGFKPCD